MADKEQILLPLAGWDDVLEQLSLPLRAYQRQLRRTHEPVLRFNGQLWQAHRAWLRCWERSLRGERLVVLSGFRILEGQLKLLLTVVTRCQERLSAREERAAED